MVCSPAPSWLVAPLLGSLYPSKTLQTETAEERLLLSGLENRTYKRAVTVQLAELLQRTTSRHSCLVMGRRPFFFRLFLRPLFPRHYMNRSAFQFFQRLSHSFIVGGMGTDCSQHLRGGHMIHNRADKFSDHIGGAPAHHLHRGFLLFCHGVLF